MLGIGIYAWTHGNFSKLTTPYDPDGKGCGNAADGREAFPYIYFASPHADVLSLTIAEFMGNGLRFEMPGGWR